MRTRALLAVSLLLLGAPALAGCIEHAAVDDGIQPAAADLGVPTAGVTHGVDGALVENVVDLPRAVGAQLSTGHDATEPTVAVSPDGAVFMTAFSEGGVRSSRPSTLRSTDDGATWVDVGPTIPTGDGNPPFTNDPYVHVDTDTGRLFQMDLYLLLCSYMSFSDDNGESWTTNPFACGHPMGVHDHQTMTTAKSRGTPTVGYENLVYYCVNRVADSACATSVNGGLTFGPLVPVYEGMGSEGFCGGLTGHLTAGPEGRTYLPRGYCDTVKIAVTEDDGLTWDVHTIAEEETQGHEVRAAVDEAGNVYAFWIANETGLPRLSVSTDHGATWTEPVTVSAPGVTATEFPAIAAGAEGRIAFAYIGTTIEDGYTNKSTGIGGLMGDILGEPRPEEWANATWNAYIGVVTDALADVPVVTTVTANDPEDPIARGLCGRTRCGGMNDFIDIDIGADGRPWAAFVDVCTAECIDDKDVWYDESIGFAGTLASGPALRGDLVALPALGAGVVAESGDAEEEGDEETRRSLLDL